MWRNTGGARAANGCASCSGANGGASCSGANGGASCSGANRRTCANPAARARGDRCPRGHRSA